MSRIYQRYNQLLKLRKQLHATALSKKRVQLSHLLHNTDILKVALYRVKSNSGGKTAGVDEQTKYTFDKTDFVDLQKSLKDGSYQPEIIRRVMIPKPQGGERPLGIPTFADRIVQETARLLLEPVTEAHFLPANVGFRPNRSQADALQPIMRHLTGDYRLSRKIPRKFRGVTYHWVVEGDIKGAFDTHSHDKLIKQMDRMVSDNYFRSITTKWLKTGIYFDNEYTFPKEGTPQGGVMSPLLFNVGMHPFDEWMFEHFPDKWTFEFLRSRDAGIPYLDALPKTWSGMKDRMKRLGQHSVRYHRFADDFVILATSRTKAEDIKHKLESAIPDLTGMELSREKTKVTHASKGFTFLGIDMGIRNRKEPRYLGQASIRANARRTLPNGKTKFVQEKTPQGYLWHEPNQKRLRGFIDRLKEEVSSKNNFLDDLSLLYRLNEILRGYRYYNTDYLRINDPNAGKVNHIANRSFTKFLRRKHKLSAKAFRRRYYRRNPVTKTMTIAIDKQLRDGSKQPIYLYQIPSTKFVHPRRWDYWQTQIPFESNEHFSQALFVGENLYNRHPAYGMRVYQINREKAMLRDGLECQSCKISNKLEVHHIDPLPVATQWVKLSRSDQVAYHRLSNLQTLCKSCHSKTIRRN